LAKTKHHLVGRQLKGRKWDEVGHMVKKDCEQHCESSSSMETETTQTKQTDKRFRGRWFYSWLCSIQEDRNSRRSRM